MEKKNYCCPQKAGKPPLKVGYLWQLGVFFLKAPTAQNSPEFHFCFINSFIQPSRVISLLGMYNFGRAMKFRLLLVRMMSEWLMSIGQYFGMKFIKKGNLRRAIQKHEWMPRMLPTHSTLPPSPTEKVICLWVLKKWPVKYWCKALKMTKHWKFYVQ